MSKSYLLLIGALMIITLAVGAFAYFRSTTNPVPNPSSQNPTAPNSPGQPTPPTNPGPSEMMQNEISLIVSSPVNGQIVSTTTITVTGKTTPNADVSVNDKEVKADAKGNFSATISLDEGDNTIFVTASNDAGQSSDWEATVTYTPTQ